MATTNLTTQLKVQLDKSGIPAELKQIQKIVDKYPIKLTTDLQVSGLKKQYKSLCQEMANELNKTFQSNLSGADIFSAYQTNAKQLESTLEKTSTSGTNALNRIWQAWNTFVPNPLIRKTILTTVSEFLHAIPEIEKADTLLTQIGKTSGMTSGQLKQLGTDAFTLSSKYGKTASDYLTEVQNMAKAGFSENKGSQLAEQSLLAQSAGNMNRELADSYILAANAAYKLNGEAQNINEVIDGQNNIAVRNRLALADIAAAMTLAGNTAADYRVSLADISAMIGVLTSAEKLGGIQAGTAITELLSRLQDTSSDAVVSTLDKANASMTEMVNGSERLRSPIEILRDLSDTFRELNDTDPLKSEILSNIGGENQSANLAALLNNMDTYDKMLVDYSEGSGSALETSRQNVDTLSGSLKMLQNSWTEFVNSILTSDGLKTGANLLNSLVQGAAKLTKTLTPIGTIGAGAGLFAGLKNIGKPV